MKALLILVTFYLIVISCNKEEPEEFTKKTFTETPGVFSPPEWIQGMWLNSTMQFGIYKFAFTKNNCYLNDEFIPGSYYSREITCSNYGQESYLIGTSDTSSYFKFIRLIENELLWIIKNDNKYATYYLYSEFKLE